MSITNYLLEIYNLASQRRKYTGAGANGKPSRRCANDGLPLSG